jgi:hypothetical protein
MGVTNDIARVAIEASLILELIEPENHGATWPGDAGRPAPGAGPLRHLAGQLPVDLNTICKRNPDAMKLILDWLRHEENGCPNWLSLLAVLVLLKIMLVCIQLTKLGTLPLRIGG